MTPWCGRLAAAGAPRTASSVYVNLFQATPRDKLNDRRLPVWSYLSSYDYGTPFLGNFHGSDALHIFFGIWPNKAMRSTRTCYFNFVYNLDPNIGVGSYSRWAWSNDYIKDDFRSGAEAWLDDNSHLLHI
ncbi:hypothetical protein G6O67_007763 [Ophiocordyceps sinensis]|uniref:Carboxylesterase type B domain-containing protein n=1 Tax=Ophiocordyceps sinensis TaxID=72228 RepID=A0A8H4LUV8_9HYPO|nr:hypothetical protein G6O67_007763 [Ophiocordyceps sinensis]